MLSQARHLIVGIIDFFHRPFARWIPTQTFRYLACGGSNTVLNWVIYSVSFNVWLHRHDSFHLTRDIIITAPVLAYIISFCISFPIGFILSRHVVFPESNLHGRVQFFRYALTTVTFIILTYVLIKLFAIILPFRADISYIFVMVITAVLSYLSQRFFTFKVTDEEEEMIVE